MKLSLAISLVALVSGTLAAGPQGGFDPAAGECTVRSAAVRELGSALGASTTCDAKSIGFWTNKHGKTMIEAGNFLSYLPSLHVVDEDGGQFSTDDFETYKDWMKDANAVNMAYMLSAQLVAMQFNVLSGNVSERCIVSGDTLGDISIGRLIDQAAASLRKDGYTPAGDPKRHRQEVLKNALDKANNNLTWL